MLQARCAPSPKSQTAHRPQKGQGSGKGMETANSQAELASVSYFPWPTMRRRLSSGPSPCEVWGQAGRGAAYSGASGQLWPQKALPREVKLPERRHGGTAVAGGRAASAQLLPYLGQHAGLLAGGRGLGRRDGDG